MLSPAAMDSAAFHPVAMDPTNHGANFPVVAVLAVGILLLIGLLVVLLTRRR